MEEKKDNPYKKIRLYFLAAAILIGVPNIFGFYGGQTGRLLIASPKAANDINFSKSVIYVHYNGVWGAQGVVINEPLSTDSAEKINKDNQYSSYDLFKGGPVSFPVSRIVALDTPSKASRFRTQPLTLVDYNNYEAYLEDKKTKGNAEDRMEAELDRRPIFFGFAGWITGQLESEIRSGIWRVVECDSLDFPGTQGADLWEYLSGNLQDTSCTSKN